MWISVAVSLLLSVSVEEHPETHSALSTSAWCLTVTKRKTNTKTTNQPKQTHAHTHKHTNETKRNKTKKKTSCLVLWWRHRIRRCSIQKINPSTLWDRLSCWEIILTWKNDANLRAGARKRWWKGTIWCCASFCSTTHLTHTLWWIETRSWLYFWLSC